MADIAYFTTLLHEFRDGLYFHYSEVTASGYERLTQTIKASQILQLGGHTLTSHVLAADREGMCHQLANEKLVVWCGRPMSEPPTGTAKRAFNSPLELGLRMLFLLEAAGEGARICSGW